MSDNLEALFEKLNSSLEGEPCTLSDILIKSLQADLQAENKLKLLTF